MNRKILKFKKLLNEYRAEFYELEYVNEVMKDALIDFDLWLNKFINKKQVQIPKLQKKHSDRVKQLFTPKPAIEKTQIKEQRRTEFDSKKIFRQIARRFHPDTIPLDDPRQEEYQNIFQSATNAIDEGNWGKLFDIVDKYDLDLGDYDSAIKSLELDLQRVKAIIQQKKSTYAWLLYECDSDQEKDSLIRRYLDYIYVDYQDPT